MSVDELIDAELRDTARQLQERIDYLEVENTMALELYSEYKFLNEQLAAENTRLRAALAEIEHEAMMQLECYEFSDNSALVIAMNWFKWKATSALRGEG
jgi:hypothetical protein